MKFYLIKEINLFILIFMDFLLKSSSSPVVGYILTEKPLTSFGFVTTKKATIAQGSTQVTTQSHHEPVNTSHNKVQISDKDSHSASNHNSHDTTQSHAVHKAVTTVEHDDHVTTQQQATSAHHATVQSHDDHPLPVTQNSHDTPGHAVNTSAHDSAGASGNHNSASNHGGLQEDEPVVNNHGANAHSTSQSNSNSDHGNSNHDNSPSSNQHGTNHGDTSHGTDSHASGGDHGSTGDHGGDGHGASGGHGGGHHVSPPSYQLHQHSYVYKPEGFEMFTKQIAIKKYIVGFNYPTVNHYDKFIIRVRYHGYEDYSTNKLDLNRTEPNQIIMKDFLNAQYIICVTLFSSSNMPEYPPISTSDMCIDFTVGESHPIGGHHSSTGLLSPLLLAVAAVLLAYITIGNSIKRSYQEKKKLNKAREEPRRKSSAKGSIHKSNTEKQFEDALQIPDEHKWQTAAQLCRIVENDSRYNLNGYYDNHRPAPMYDYHNDHRFSSNKVAPEYDALSSTQTLRHLLDSKPWATNSATDRSPQNPTFFIKS